jgi:plastocyanin
LYFGRLKHKKTKQMKTILLSTIALSVLLLGGCKKPTAGFTMNKTEFFPGETAILTNTSTDAHSYEWTLHDGSTSTNTDVTYDVEPIIPFFYGSFDITLKASSKNGKKTDQVSQVISIVEPYGDVVFWAKSGVGAGSIAVTVDGVAATITSRSSSAPSCGASGFATFTELPTGTYDYYASDGVGFFDSGTLVVTERGCTKVELL